ncbi:hypothetical protein [Streptomyces sp. NPDC051098]|uniref:hypothetical protein n=1 Tax=Streptomyces sp. NPDC051098 TaxID=3155411 RepID=UPI0034417B23
MAGALGYHSTDPDRGARLCFHLKPGSYDTAGLIEVLEQMKVFYRGERVVLVWDGLTPRRADTRGERRPHRLRALGNGPSRRRRSLAPGQPAWMPTLFAACPGIVCHGCAADWPGLARASATLR